MHRRQLIGTLIVVAATAVAVASAGAAVPPQGKIGPHQQFGGLVNHQSGVTHPVTIRMACFGAVRPGEKGHPMGGQTVEVFRSEVIVGDFGNTGSRANRIVAFFGPPLRHRAATTPTGSTVTFTRYGVNKYIPTALKLPCSGMGVVTFVPRPTTPIDTSYVTVSVRYVGQP